MRQTLNGRLPLLVAPALALTATVLLAVLGGQPGPVLLWGGLATLVCAVPLALPHRYLNPAVWICTALVAVLVVLGAASIGLFYSPVLVALPLSRYFTDPPEDELWPRDEDPCEDSVNDRG